MSTSRRRFLKLAGAATAASLAKPSKAFNRPPNINVAQQPSGPADYTLRIAATPIELAPNRIISTTTYNGQFPGPLLRFKEGQPVTIDVHNDTDTPEQLHWHGQFVPVDVDGAAEEGTPYIPAHGTRRIQFTPRPSGIRFYHTHVRAGADLAAGQYNGLAGPVYIEPAHNPGAYDREVFLTLKEFEPTLGRGGDMAMDFLTPATTDKALRDAGESAMKASLASGMPHGYEVGYGSFTINGKMLGHGEPIRVKTGERVLFHIVNASATEIRSLALPGHTFKVVALDGNPVPTPANVPVLWLGTAERISAIVDMKHPGVWIMGDLADDDRRHGMGIVIEYAGHSTKPLWLKPPPFHWSYARFGKPGTTPRSPGETPDKTPDQTIDMTFAKQNAAAEGFNRWTINNVAFSMENMSPAWRLHQGRRYRIRMRNASDDIHPIHLHRHSFELTNFAGIPTSGIIKDVVMVGGYQQVEIDFTADNPGLTLFHCHQTLHMDYGFMTLFDYP
ncbi:MAG TPA: multicopper oxidase domain-containing protein [Edaphobacter sp.]|jgi:FtsP/CotA-like multicopper oxidase with cupredoxin domain|nr:multicopper oxidase domain-containing protein [Edaphobacter sp.]